MVTPRSFGTLDYELVCHWLIFDAFFLVEEEAYETPEEKKEEDEGEVSWSIE